MTERCPTCGGPVERVGASKDTFAFRAIPDTLEDVEAEAHRAYTYGSGHWSPNDSPHEGGLHEERDSYVKALRRLFNGCAECGREPLPLAMHNGGYAYGVEDGEHRAYQRAAKMLKETLDFYGDESGVGEVALDKLRRLADGGDAGKGEQ